MQPLKPYFLGLERAAREARRHVAEGDARRRQARRPRRRRLYRPPRLLLRDARQLLVRRLLQGRGDRLRLGVRHRAHGLRPATGSGRPCSPAIPSSGSARTRSRCGAGCGVGLPRERIVGLPRSENFWQAADTGPVRPLLGDLLRPRPGARLRRARTAARAASAASATSSSGTSSSWSSTSPPTATLTPLPQQNIDTGLGLERGAMLLQDVGSIFDTDGYQAIMRWVARGIGRRLRRLRAGDQGAPRPRRPRPGDDLPDRGGRHALQRGPRLHPPAADPARRPAGRPHRPRGRLPAARAS